MDISKETRVSSRYPCNSGLAEKTQQTEHGKRCKDLYKTIKRIRSSLFEDTIKVIADSNEAATDNRNGRKISSGPIAAPEAVAYYNTVGAWR